MTDLVERLRNDLIISSPNDDEMMCDCIMCEAAEEIERLRARIAELEATYINLATD